MPWQPMHIEFFLAPAAASPASAASTGVAAAIRPSTATVEISREGVMSCFLIMDLRGDYTQNRPDRVSGKRKYRRPPAPVHRPGNRSSKNTPNPGGRRRKATGRA